MSSEGEAQSITNILSGFTSAESAAEEVIDLILAEGGRQLYQAYIDRKSFSFSSEAISSILISELKMCFVRHDEGEPPPVDAIEDADRIAKTVVEAAAPAIPGAPTSVVLPIPAVPERSYAASDDGEVVPEVQDPEAPVGDGAAQPEGDVPGVGDTATLGDEGGDEMEVSCCSWALEAEPVRCRIDTWARACVPVRRTLVRPKDRKITSDQKGKQQGARGKKPSSASTRSPSRLAGMMTPTNSMNRAMGVEESDKGKITREAMIPLEIQVDNDEEEAAMREMKEREAKRKREEENRIQRKVSEEAEEAARLAQVKDQMKNKPYTYDSNGNIIWVTPMAADKLPSANPIPSYVLRRGEHAEAFPSPERKGSFGKGKELGKKVKGKTKDVEFVDTFKKFSSQQPPMMEAMKMSPGVQLRERGAHKSGEDLMSNVRASNTLMTRRDYENLVQSGGSGYPAKDKDEGKDAEGAEAKPAAREVAAPGQPEASGGDAPAEPRRSNADGQKDTPTASGQPRGMKATAVKPVSPDPGLVPVAPNMPRPEQPVPPPSFRRVQMKREAIGYGLSTRERVPTGTGTRFPGCAAAPLLGATMGHGLLPQGSKHEEYYFPNNPQLAVQLGIADEDVVSAPASPPSAPITPRAPDGHIVSKNPELVKRLFNR